MTLLLNPPRAVAQRAERAGAVMPVGVRVVTARAFCCASQVTGMDADRGLIRCSYGLAGPFHLDAEAPADPPVTAPLVPGGRHRVFLPWAAYSRQARSSRADHISRRARRRRTCSTAAQYKTTTAPFTRHPAPTMASRCHVTYQIIAWSLLHCRSSSTAQFG